MATSPSNVEYSLMTSHRSHPSVLVNSTVSSILMDGGSAGLDMEKQIVHLMPETGSINRTSSI